MTEAFEPPLPETLQPDPVVQDIAAWREEQGFHEGHHGTYWNEERSRYSYEKPCHRFGSEQQAQDSVRVARYLTAKGMLHPQTQWHVGKRDDSSFQLLVTSPALDAWEPRNLTAEEAFSPDSIVMGLARKVVPEVDLHAEPFVRPPDDSLIWLLDFAELSHYDNWGTDLETGKQYPLDVEAISFRNRSPLIARNWSANNPPGQATSIS